jgi:hypothetical protein
MIGAQVGGDLTRLYIFIQLIVLVGIPFGYRFVPLYSGFPRVQFALVSDLSKQA